MLTISHLRKSKNTPFSKARSALFLISCWILYLLQVLWCQYAGRSIQVLRCRSFQTFILRPDCWSKVWDMQSTFFGFHANYSPNFMVRRFCPAFRKTQKGFIASSSGTVTVVKTVSDFHICPFIQSLSVRNFRPLDLDIKKAHTPSSVHLST